MLSLPEGKRITLGDYGSTGSVGNLDPRMVRAHLAASASQAVPFP